MDTSQLIVLASRILPQFIASFCCRIAGALQLRFFCLVALVAPSSVAEKRLINSDTLIKEV